VSSDEDLTSPPVTRPTRGVTPFPARTLPDASPRFEPGAIVAGRYRLVALLGRGGMGEVYRADDLTLDQPVALKFLPAGVVADAARLTQFHNELRVARQVSHKNVCRLYPGQGAGGPRGSRAADSVRLRLCRHADRHGTELPDPAGLSSLARPVGCDDESMEPRKDLDRTRTAVLVPNEPA
jgi:hypothetical protein